MEAIILAKVNNNNKQNFYLGTGVELYFQSQFYMLGYEAYKLNPDFGLDLQVTNKYESEYKQKEQFDKFFQIKSTPSFENGKCEIYLDKSDFDLIVSKENHYLIMAVCNFKSNPEPLSLVHSYEYFSISLDAMLEADFNNGFFNTKEKKKMLDSYNSNIISYVWINSNQLKQLYANNFIKETTFSDGTIKYIFILEISNNSIIGLYSNKTNHYDFIISEVRNLFYIFNDFRNCEKVKNGTIFLT